MSPPRKPRPAGKALASPGEAALELHLRAYGRQAECVRQHPFAEALGRGYRFDFAFPALSLAVEIDGAVHRIKGRFKADIERHNVAQLLGWRVLRFSPADVASGRAIDAVRALLRGDEGAALNAIHGAPRQRLRG